MSSTMNGTTDSFDGASLSTQRVRQHGGTSVSGCSSIDDTGAAPHSSAAVY